MKGFALVWSKTLDSSIWRRESKETRLVWMTLLMMKDAEGIVLASKVGLADRARVTDEECAEALTVLLSPDPNDTSKVEEGRRIREIPGGWQVVNHDLYRFSTEAKREFWRKDKEEQRAKASAKLGKPKRIRKAKGLPGEPLTGERQYIRTLERDGQAAADALLDKEFAEQTPWEAMGGNGEP